MRTTNVNITIVLCGTPQGTFLIALFVFKVYIHFMAAAVTGVVLIPAHSTSAVVGTIKQAPSERIYQGESE